MITPSRQEFTGRNQDSADKKGAWIMKMKPIGIVWLAAGCLCGACNSHSPTEPVAAKSAPPVITDLSNPATATLLSGPDIQGQRPGVLPITFSFTDPGGNLSQVTVTLPSGTATNRLQGVSGRISGSAGLQQSLLLPPSGTRVSYSLQVSDAGGNASNVLTGSFVSP
jgi:hypothetical protein